MKHQFGGTQAYDIGRIPVNREARVLLAPQPPLDFNDPNAEEALRICEKLKGSGCFNRGVSAMEAASLICSLLKKREVVETTLSPDLLKLKSEELAHKKAGRQLHEAEVNLRREKQRESIRATLAREKENASLLGCFKDMAKAMLPPDQYSMLWDLADLARKERENKLENKLKP